MISPRYAGFVAGVLALALVPTVIHSYRSATVSDGLTTAAVPQVLDGSGSSATARRAAWVENNFASTDWIERVYRVGRADVTVFVGRSYDAKRLYHHPELALLRGSVTTPAGVGRAAARPDVPLHLLKTARGGGEGIAVYALLYDGRFIEDPIRFQLRTSVELLFTGRKPLTLFMASDLAGSLGALDDAPSTRVLLAAIAGFERQAGTAAPR